MLQELKDYFAQTMQEISIDCVIFGFHAGELKVLLLRWKGSDSWSLPGGRIFYQESVSNAVHRILRERTGLENVFLQQFYTFGDVDRYKNFSPTQTLQQLEQVLGKNALQEVDLAPRTISIGYFALVEFDQVVPNPDLFTDECRWWAIPEVPLLLFDHNEMIDLALNALRKQLSYQPVGYELLPEKFTMTELQQVYETILGKTLERRNFYKMMSNSGVLERLEEKRTGSANRSPFLYRFIPEKYEHYRQDSDSFSIHFH